MSSWKRVLTTDDLESVTDTNLGISNLSQSSVSRTYTLPSNSSGSSLIFQGTVNSITENLLRIVADSNSSLQSNSYAYSPSLRIGSFSLTGAQNSNGYSLPQHTSAVGEGEIMVSDNFGSTSGEMSFKSFDEWVGSPYSSSPSGLSNDSMLSQSTPNPSYDSVLVFDASQGANGGFAHQHLKDFRAPVFLTFGRNDTANQSATTVTMRGVNGVPHDIDGSLGFVATRYMTLMAASMNFLKTTSGTGSRRVNIYKNGTLVCVTNYFGSSTSQNETVSASYTFDPGAVSSLQRPENFIPGDVISVAMVRSGTISTNRHSVVLEFV
jgi:hypothetical protein